MTDQPTDQPTDEPGTGLPASDALAAEETLTPEQEQQVRQLLVDARELDPMPDTVVARLDRVLAELSASSANGPANPPVDHAAAPDTTAQVTSLVAVRRQRAGRLLLAAAAVVVVGIGVGQLLDVGGVSGSGDASSPTASQADGEDAGGVGRSELTAPEAAGSSAEAPTFVLDRPVRVESNRFSTDVERARRLAEGTSKKEDRQLNSGGAFAAECMSADWGQGTFVPVRYDGDAGVLVFRSPTGDSQVVDLFQCGSADVLRSITLSAP